MSKPIAPAPVPQWYGGQAFAAALIEDAASSVAEKVGHVLCTTRCNRNDPKIMHCLCRDAAIAALRASAAPEPRLYGEYDNTGAAVKKKPDGC